MVETRKKEVANKKDMQPDTDTDCDNSQLSDEVGSEEEYVLGSESNSE